MVVIAMRIPTGTCWEDCPTRVGAAGLLALPQPCANPPWGIDAQYQQDKACKAVRHCVRMRRREDARSWERLLVRRIRKTAARGGTAIPAGW